MAEKYSEMKEPLSSQPAETSVTVEEMTMISRMMFRNQYLPLARKLKITKQKVEEFDVYCTTRHLGDEEIVIRILEEWKGNNGNDATKDLLKEALIFIDRRDIANKVFSNLPEKKYDPIEMKEQYRETQLMIEEYQITVYEEIELPQVIWTNRVLPLEELYVNLELTKTVDDYDGSWGESVKLEDLFSQIGEKDPVRILVEGGPGYGKTTLGLKLLNDWGRNRDYIRSKFKMVFYFELRYFEKNDSVEEVLKRECEVIDINGDEGLDCIKAFENETLLILDGYDELNIECKGKILPLIEKKTYPSMFVVVTSRRGMFEVEKKKGIRRVGLLEKSKGNVKIKHLWSKKVLIKGLTTDKIEIFLKKYFDKDFINLKLKINSITKGEMVEVFKCPLFLILLAMMLEEKTRENVNSKTVLYKEFFNFIIKRSLIREKKISEEEEEEFGLDIFNETCDHSKLIQTLDQFGQLAIRYLCENKLMFEENEVLEYCKDQMIFHFGFLTKIPKIEGRRKENFYQPIHKSFLEFVAAFAMWNLFKTNENQFNREIERIGNTGLKPTEDSLFYVFLGGFMNVKASVLFKSLEHYGLWFNIGNHCFTNILLEIKDFHSFFPSFQPILDSFIPSLYSIDGFVGLSEDYSESEIHSLILKHSSDRQLINVLLGDSVYSVFNVADKLHVTCFKLHINSFFRICSNENKNWITCKNIICDFSEHFEIFQWNHFVSFFNSIQSENVNFQLTSRSNEINSHVLALLHKELIEGQWKQKNINQVKYYLNEFDDPFYLSFLVDLVKKGRISEGVFLWIKESERRRGKENLKRVTEELFNAVLQSKSVKEFAIVNNDSNLMPEFNFNQASNYHLKSLYFQGSLKLFNLNKKKNEKYFEDVSVDLPNAFNDFLFTQNLQDVKHYCCKLECLNLLFKINWPSLKELEELELIIPNAKQIQLLNSFSQLRNLQVLSMNVFGIKSFPSDSKLHFINLFSSPNLRICEFLFLQNIELFSFLSEVLMEGLKRKEKADNDHTFVSNEGMKVQLQELFILFDEIRIDFIKLKKCSEIQLIRSMLRSKKLQQCCWANNYNTIKSDEVESLFPSNDKFRTSLEVSGMNPNSSCQSQFNYRWFSYIEKFCIKFFDE